MPGRLATLEKYFRCGWETMALPTPKRWELSDRPLYSLGTSFRLFPPVFLAGGRVSRGILVFLLLPGTSAAADIQRESWLTVHGGQHTSGPTVPSRGKAYLVKAVQAYASEVLRDVVRRNFSQHCVHSHP